jgi:hypothetical protein
MPLGWRVWRQTEVPTPIVQAAIAIRDHARDYRLGAIAQTMTYGGQSIALWVSSHSWTWKNGVLVTGICVPGVSVLVAVPAGSGGIGSATADNLDTPDPTAAVYALDEPPRSTSWPLVLVSGLAIAATAAAFVLAIKLAGRPRLS